MILIIYTTHYRAGSSTFKRIAETLHKEKSNVNNKVSLKGIRTKKELVETFELISKKNDQITEYHFVGHAGMYGPMYGTKDYPEQLSPFEWKTLQIPFAKDAKAYFHCCRSARWFAPFFESIYHIETFGYHNYTAFTSNKNQYHKVKKSDSKVYAIGCIGRKSHGIMGSIKKHLLKAPLEKMVSFKPEHEVIDTSYDNVANLYDAVFEDIKVRKDEWNWIKKHFSNNKDLTVADIGCGNGALLKELAPNIKKGIGLDASPKILENARLLNKENKHLSFEQITGPNLPLPDHSVDIFISLLSFRYLDWDPLMNELKRVVKPGGKILIIDMVTVPPKWFEIPALLKAKLEMYLQRSKNKKYHSNLTKLVTHPDWKKMLKHNPIRAEHEMKWYLESRFPNTKVEKINIGMNSCILAFDSGNIDMMKDINLTYP